MTMCVWEVADIIFWFWRHNASISSEGSQNLYKMARENSSKKFAEVTWPNNYKIYAE